MLQIHSASCYHSPIFAYSKDICFFTNPTFCTTPTFGTIIKRENMVRVTKKLDSTTLLGY